MHVISGKRAANVSRSMQAAHAQDDAEQPTGFEWQALGANVQSAHEAASRQARILSRALAAHGLVHERDASPEEFEDRLDAALETVWPDSSALQGYDLHSSLGAHLVAKVAFDLVPAGRTGLRREPLRRQGMMSALLEHGVDEVAAASVLGDWQQAQDGFQGSAQGLSASMIAGLAERTLTRAERAEALNQMAVSPRCLNRLASTLSLLAAVRVLVPVLPPETMGSQVLIAVVGLVLGRPDRVAQLFDGRAKTLRLKTLTELAQAQWALHQGEAASLEADPLSGSPRPEDEDRSPPPREDTEVMADAFDDSDAEHDEPEVLEQRDDPDAVQADPPSPKREAFATGAAALLGIRAAPASSTTPTYGVHSDGPLLEALRQQRDGPVGDEELTERISINPLLHGHGLEVEDLPYDPLCVPVRAALRAVVASAEGIAPSEQAVKDAQSMDWALARARALALVVQGDLPGAQAAVRGFPEALAPEGRWAKDRALRFDGRTAEPVSPQEARPVAAALISDLVQQLARSFCGAVEDTVDG